MSTLLTAISNSDTTISTSNDPSFPASSGLIVIGTEQIAYASNYQGTLYGCVRGVNSTSAASHLAGVNVSVLDFYSSVAGGSETFSSITVSGLTASKALTTNSSKVLTSSATTDTELGYVAGVTSAVQTQLNTKLTSSTGVTDVHADSNSALHGAVQLISGSNVTLTQSGQGITIAASGGTSFVRQMVQQAYSTHYTSSTASYTSTGYSISITPATSSSRIKIEAYFPCSATGETYLTFYRNNTTNVSPGAGLLTRINSTSAIPVAISCIDSPSTTSATTYTIYVQPSSGTTVVGQDNIEVVLIATELAS